MASSAILTPVGTASFINLERPRSLPGVIDSEPRYSINLIFDKTAQKSEEFRKLQEGIDAALKERWPNKLPHGLRSPFHDGAEKAGVYSGYNSGDIFIQPWSKNKPPVVNRQRQDVIDFTEFYAGWLARAFVKPWAFDTAGNKGCLLLLDTVQFLKAGPRLDGRAVASDFPQDEDEEEDAI